MKRILVCLDASPRAAVVLSTAADLAKRTGAKLRLLRAVGLPPEIDQEMLVHSGGNIIDTLKEKAQTELAGLLKGVPADTIEASDILLGTPWDAICREAKAVDADLVIIGSRGYSCVDRVLCSTAAKVVNHCDRSVLVVKSAEPAE